MEARRDITEVLPIWARVWANEKGTTVQWMEYTAAAIESRIKWKFADSHIKSAPFGLNLQLIAVAPSVLDTKPTAEDAAGDKTEQPSTVATPAEFSCQAGETIFSAANRIRGNSSTEDSFILSGAVAISCARKIDLKSEAKPGEHRKSVIPIKDILTDLARYRDSEGETLVSAADKSLIAEALNGITVGEDIRFTLPILEMTAKKTGEEDVAPEKSVWDRFRLGSGSSKKASSEVVMVDPAAQVKESEGLSTLGMNTAK